MSYDQFEDNFIAVTLKGEGERCDKTFIANGMGREEEESFDWEKIQITINVSQTKAGSRGKIWLQVGYVNGHQQSGNSINSTSSDIWYNYSSSIGDAKSISLLRFFLSASRRDHFPTFPFLELSVRSRACLRELFWIRNQFASRRKAGFARKGFHYRGGWIELQHWIHWRREIFFNNFSDISQLATIKIQLQHLTTSVLTSPHQFYSALLDLIPSHVFLRNRYSNEFSCSPLRSPFQPRSHHEFSCLVHIFQFLPFQFVNFSLTRLASRSSAMSFAPSELWSFQRWRMEKLEAAFSIIPAKTFLVLDEVFNHARTCFASPDHFKMQSKQEWKARAKPFDV